MFVGGIPPGVGRDQVSAAAPGVEPLPLAPTPPCFVTTARRRLCAVRHARRCLYAVGQRDQPDARLRLHHVQGIGRCRRRVGQNARVRKSTDRQCQCQCQCTHRTNAQRSASKVGPPQPTQSRTRLNRAKQRWWGAQERPHAPRTPVSAGARCTATIATPFPPPHLPHARLVRAQARLPRPRDHVQHCAAEGREPLSAARRRPRSQRRRRRRRPIRRRRRRPLRRPASLPAA